jgi:poly-beta-hydroxyalkanoate depolymerase
MKTMIEEVAPTFAPADCTSDSTDGECVRRCLRGETEAFDEIVLRYQKPVFNAIFHMVNDYEDTRDLSQSAFMKAFMHLKSFDQRRPAFQLALPHRDQRGDQLPLR